MLINHELDHDGEMLHCLGRLNNLKKRQNLGTISEDFLSEQLNQIRYAVVQRLNEIKTGQLPKSTAQPSDPPLENRSKKWQIMLVIGLFGCVILGMVYITKGNTEENKTPIIDKPDEDSIGVKVDTPAVVNLPLESPCEEPKKVDKVKSNPSIPRGKPSSPPKNVQTKFDKITNAELKCMDANSIADTTSASGRRQLGYCLCKAGQVDAGLSKIECAFKKSKHYAKGFETLTFCLKQKNQAGYANLYKKKYTDVLAELDSAKTTTTFNKIKEALLDLEKSIPKMNK